ncbi:MAG: hypothetical protein ACE5I1_11165 [bacterium]
MGAKNIMLIFSKSVRIRSIRQIRVRKAWDTQFGFPPAIASSISPAEYGKPALRIS